MNFNISNLANIVFSSVSKNTNTQSNNSVQNNQNFTTAQTNQELPANTAAKSVETIYYQISQTSSNVMNNVQQNLFLRDMMGLPKDWANLLKEFTSMENSQLNHMLQNLNTQGQSQIQEALFQLLSANAKINLQALAEQINKNSVLMADKLLKLMGSANMATNHISQLKEIMLIGASIANSANVNPQEFIRDIIQMYLPWLPLVPPKEEDFNEIEGKFSKENSKNGQTIFYLATKYLGYFKVEIFSDNETDIYMTNISEIEDNELRENLCEEIKTGIKHNSINANLYFSRKFDEETINIKEKQLFIVNSDNSIIGLTLIQLLSRIIFEFDEKQGQRYKKLQNI